MRRFARYLAVAFLAAGCSDWADEAIKEAKGREDDAVKVRRKMVEQRFEELAKIIAKEPLDLENNKYEVDKANAEAQMAGMMDFSPTVEKLKKQAEEVFATAADEKVREAVAAARAMASGGKVAEARKKLNNLPPRLRTTKFWASVEAELRHLDQVERGDLAWKWAKEKAERFKQSKEWEKARGVLEGFLALVDAIPAFKESGHENDARSALSEIKGEVDKARAARASEEAIPWLPAFRGSERDLGGWDLSEPDAIKMRDKVAVFKYDGDEKSGVAMRFGEEDWEEYVVELRLRILKGPVYFNVHGELEGAEGERVRTWKDVFEFKDYDTPFGRWFKIRFEVRNGEFNVLRFDPVSSTGKPLKCREDGKLRKGPFEIRIKKGAEVEIEKVWVKLYKPARAAASGGSEK